MDLSRVLQQHYLEAEMDQSRLKHLYDAQQTEIGQAALRAQKELASRFRSQGVQPVFHEVDCMINAKTGKRLYFLKKG